MLVITGATPEGKKELPGFQVGTRESTQSWRELVVDIKARGLAMAPKIAVGPPHACCACIVPLRLAGHVYMPEKGAMDGALGFWKALDQVWPDTRHQRCWVHKIGNVLNTFPKSMAPVVQSDLHGISPAETRADALAAMDIFKEKYAASYPKGGHMPVEGARCAHDVLRLPSRALGPSAQPSRASPVQG